MRAAGGLEFRAFGWKMYSKLFVVIILENIIFYETSNMVSTTGRSTSLALIKLYDKISTAIDHKKLTIAIFLDLSKAFDTVDHKIIFTELEHYVFHGLVNS